MCLAWIVFLVEFESPKGLLDDLSTKKEILILCWTALSVSAKLLRTMETIANAPKTETREQRFYALYCAAFQGLHGQFDRMLWCDNYGDVHIDWNALDASHSPERSKRLAKIALNSARAALELLDKRKP